MRYANAGEALVADVPKRFTDDEVRRRLRDEVAAAGGAKKWLCKHKLSGILRRRAANG